jgi:4-hydroxy-tetrahydrodipicolinate synthase
VRYRKNPSLITGSITPLVTPFDAEGHVDHPSLRSLVDWQLRAGTHGLSVGGSTGEPSAQSTAERAAAIRTVADAVDGQVPFLAGTGSARLEDTLELTAAAYDAGADVALVISPYYARPTQDGLYDWYATVAREFPDLPIAIYNVPSRTAVDVAPATVARLFRDYENVVGIKETTKDLEHFSRVIRACGDELLVWSGIELLCLPALTLGAIGYISATANIAPRAMSAMYDAWSDGDHPAALRLHYALEPLVDLLFVETNPTTAKWLLHQQGRIAAPTVRPPLAHATEAGIVRVQALLRDAADLIDLEADIL